MVAWVVFVVDVVIFTFFEGVFECYEGISRLCVFRLEGQFFNRIFESNYFIVSLRKRIPVGVLAVVRDCRGFLSGSDRG